VDIKKITNWGGDVNDKVESPIVPGWDASGVVEAVGAEVTLFKAGDEVYFAGNERHLPLACVSMSLTRHLLTGGRLAQA
jgi:NADPH:quinone reductase-like Zn-dependent oxidoreductase